MLRAVIMNWMKHTAAAAAVAAAVDCNNWPSWSGTDYNSRCYYFYSGESSVDAVVAAVVVAVGRTDRTLDWWEAEELPGTTAAERLLFHEQRQDETTMILQSDGEND
jgi:hypothetical protein